MSPPALPVRRAWWDPDRWLRTALAGPGWIVDRAAPEVCGPADGEPEPADVYDRVVASARWPEAHLALEPGLHYHLDGEQVLAYQLRGRTVFAIGGMNTPDVAGLLTSFRAATGRLGVRRQLVFPLRTPDLAAAREAGFHATQVGIEAWLDLADLTFRGNRYEGVRHMRNKAERLGVVSAEHADVRPRVPALAALHAAWLHSKRPSWRMKLLVGSPGLDQPFDRRFFVAEKAGGRVEAFCTVVPGGRGRYGVDVMCRQPDAARGAMEHLLLTVCATLRAEGATALSLGPCPMAGVPIGGPRPMLTRVFRTIYSNGLANQLFGFRSLVQFKSKFRPRFEPVYFAAAPRLGVAELYLGCRMWGLV